LIEQGVLIGAIAALACAMWRLFQRSDKNRETMTSAFLEQVKASNEANLAQSQASQETAVSMIQMASAIAELTSAVRDESKSSRQAHKQMCSTLKAIRSGGD